MDSVRYGSHGQCEIWIGARPTAPNYPFQQETANCVGGINHKCRQYNFFCSTPFNWRYKAQVQAVHVVLQHPIQLAVQSASAGSTFLFAAPPFNWRYKSQVQAVHASLQHPIQLAVQITSAGSTISFAAPHSIGGTKRKCRQYMYFCSTPFNWRYKAQVQAVHVFLQHPIQLAVQTTSAGSTCCFAAPPFNWRYKSQVQAVHVVLQHPFNLHYIPQVQAVRVSVQHPIQLAVQITSAGSTCCFAAPHSIGGTNHKCRQYMLFCSTPFNWRYKSQVQAVHVVLQHPIQLAVQITSAGSTCCFAAPHSIGGTNHKYRQYMLFCSTPFNWRYKQQVQAVHASLQHPIQLAVQITSAGSTCIFAAPHSIGGTKRKCRQYMFFLLQNPIQTALPFTQQNGCYKCTHTHHTHLWVCLWPGVLQTAAWTRPFGCGL